MNKRLKENRKYLNKLLEFDDLDWIRDVQPELTICESFNRVSVGDRVSVLNLVDWRNSDIIHDYLTGTIIEIDKCNKIQKDNISKDPTILIHFDDNYGGFNLRWVNDFNSENSKSVCEDGRCMFLICVDGDSVRGQKNVRIRLLPKDNITESDEWDWVRDIAPRVKIGRPLQQRKNQFKLKIEHMHGDADAYTNNTTYINESNHNLLNTLLVLLEERFDPNNWRKFVKKIKNKGVKLSDLDSDIDTTDMDEDDEMDYWYDTLYNYGLLKGDATWDDGYARINDWTLTYFDSNGIEHETIVTKA